MATVVVPFRSTDPKHRLAPAGERERLRLADAMLADVLAAAQAVGPVIVVSADAPPDGFAHVQDPRRGQGAAVRAGLESAAGRGLPAPYLVVNADLPCATTRDLLALAGAVPEGGLALVAAADATTNALAVAGAGVFEPLYGPGSADRFSALASARRFEAPNLADDVDTIADLSRVRGRVGRHTRAVLASLDLESAA